MAHRPREGKKKLTVTDLGERFVWVATGKETSPAGEKRSRAGDDRKLPTVQAEH